MGSEQRKEYMKEYHRTWHQENKDSQRTVNQAWLKAHPEVSRKAARKLTRRQRIAALMVLGGKCCHCQCDDTRCLEIDHIIPIKGKRMMDRGQFHRSIIDGNTDGLQVLCACCHAIKTYEERARLG